MRLTANSVIAEVWRLYGLRPADLGVHCPNDVRVIDSPRSRAHSGSVRQREGVVVMTLRVSPQPCAAELAVLLAHEVAHALTLPEVRHGERWREVFRSLLAVGYGYHAEWPRHQLSNRRMNYDEAHDVFAVSMHRLGFQWSSSGYDYG